MGQGHLGSRRVLAQSDNFDQSCALGNELAMETASVVTHEHVDAEHDQGASWDDVFPGLLDEDEQSDGPDEQVRAFMFFHVFFLAHTLQVQDAVHDRESDEDDGRVKIVKANKVLEIKGIKFHLALLSDLSSVCCG